MCSQLPKALLRMKTICLSVVCEHPVSRYICIFGLGGNKTTDLGRANSALGGKDGGGSRERGRNTKSWCRNVGGTGGGPGVKSIQMALVEEGRAVGAVECHLDTGQGLISLGRVAWRTVSVVRPD